MLARVQITLEAGYVIVNNQNENKELKDNYIKMLDQINIYINEREEIKSSKNNYVNCYGNIK